jgi:hypothetical protein
MLEKNQTEQLTHLRNQPEDCVERLRPIESLCQQMLNGAVPSTTRFHFNLEGLGVPSLIEPNLKTHNSESGGAEPAAPGPLVSSDTDDNSPSLPIPHYEMDSDVKPVNEAWTESIS